MGSDLASVLVVDDAQLEQVSVVRLNVVVSSSVRVHWLAMSGMCVGGVVLDGYGKWNSYY
jgi:hypothetical protein